MIVNLKCFQYEQLHLLLNQSPIFTVHSTFTISSESMSAVMTPNVESRELALDTALPEVEDIVFASSNFVKQNQQRKKQLISILNTLILKKCIFLRVYKL